MKKLISLLATVAMVSTLFVSVVKADFEPTVVTGKAKMTNDEFVDLIGEDIPDGYDAYLVTVSFADLGDLNCEIKTKKHSGRKLQGFGYSMTFDDIDNVETDYVLSVDNVFGVDLSEGFDGSKFTTIFNAGSASAAYPTTAGTISNADGIEDAVTLVVVVKNDATVTATLATNLNVITYAANTPGTEEPVNEATMSPASLTFAPAAAPVTTTYTYTFKTYDGASDIASDVIDEGDDVIAPTAPTREGFTFAYWSESIDGAEATVDTTATADKTYYAVYTENAPAVVTIDPVADVAAVDESTTGKEFKDLQGKDVTLTKKYGIAKFDTPVDSSKTYKLYVQDTADNETEFDVDLGEVNGNASFFAIVRSATHIIKVMKLKAE